ncbi:hypothetical protein B0H13DRAFT_1850246 [Mycena leptocephala]|nr:hypothetical protein B0H13DRAFT_1850246 [Mycena leptocephala]
MSWWGPKMELCREITQTPAFLPIRFEDHHEGGLKKARKPPVKETRQVAGVEQWDMCIAMKNRMLLIRNRFYCNFFQLSVIVRSAGPVGTGVDHPDDIQMTLYG